MISSTVITEGSDISELDEVFAKINAQANGTEKVEYEQAFVFFAENEPVFFYSQPENGQVINLKRGKASGDFDLMKIKPSYGCIAAVLLPKAYKSIPSEVYRNALQSEDTEEHIYNLRQDCMYCDGERIGMLGFPDKGIMKFTFCGNEQLRGDSVGTIKTLVKTFLDAAEYED